MTATPDSSPNPELFTAAQAVAAGTDFAELQLSSFGVFWNEYRPADAACRIWHWVDGAKHCLTPDGFSARSRVYEYGGGAFCVAEQAILFVNETDQQIYRQALDGSAPQALTQGEFRYGDLNYFAGWVFAVEEQQRTHRLVAIELATQRRQVLAEGADFYAAPVVSPDGKHMAWIEWQRPQQPWTSTQLMRADRNDIGELSSARQVAGNGAEALQQPRFDANGNLWCLTDRHGWWQPWSVTEQGLQPATAMAGEHASAPWQLGACTWLPGEHGYLATWLEHGVGRLGWCAEDGTLTDFSAGYTRFRSLAADAKTLYCIAASPVATPAVIAIDRASGAIQVLAGGETPLPEVRISTPQPLRYPSGDAEAYGFFYAPAPTETNAPPPLVVFAHGGPTSACYPIFDPRIQFWTQRGFAVADLNYRGSTGYGRDYRHSLHLRWGEVDTEDACAVVAYLAEGGLIDPKCAFIRGGSAGGYTVLCALAFGTVFRGGASLYGVSDPVALAKATHKFEGDYLDWLIGDPVQDADRYKARTPLLHADNIRVPVIFFQGELDAVVPPEQTRAMLQALQANGIRAEGHFYANERHGFRQAANLEHALQEEWQFYRQIIDTAE